MNQKLSLVTQRQWVTQGEKYEFGRRDWGSDTSLNKQNSYSCDLEPCDSLTDSMNRYIIKMNGRKETPNGL